MCTGAGRGLGRERLAGALCTGAGAPEQGQERCAQPRVRRNKGGGAGAGAGVMCQGRGRWNMGVGCAQGRVRRIRGGSAGNMEHFHLPSICHSIGHIF